MVEIYTDGAASGNPGPGGLGVVMLFNGHRKEHSEGFRYTTNNRMELLAVIRALEMMKTTAHPIHIYSDSTYVINSITKGWLFGWLKTGFKGKKNKDLWLRYAAIAPKFNITFHWVKGHASNKENNRCDELAVAARKVKGLPVDPGFVKAETPSKKRKPL